MSISDGHGFEIVVFLRVRVDIFVLVELIHDEVEIGVALFGHVPHEASPNLRLGGAGLKPHKCAWEIVADAVVLGREVVRLGLSVPANQRGLRRILVKWWGIGPRLSKNFA